MTHILADSDTLLRQANHTADFYLKGAIKAIDEAFEKGFSKKHPELVATFMSVAGSDFNYANLAKAHGESIEALADSVKNFAEKIEGIPFLWIDNN